MPDSPLERRLSSTAMWALRAIGCRLADDKFTGQIVLDCSQGGVTGVTYSEKTKPEKDHGEGERRSGVE